MKELSNFFDKHSKNWDLGIEKYELENISTIMTYSQINKTDTILDVGTGTGILIPFFKKHKVTNISALDISPKMLQIFKTKFPEIKTYNIDYEKKFFDNNSFSKIFIFNTFPHLKNPKTVFKISYDYLKPNGHLIIAHSKTREQINQIHKNAGKAVEKDILISDDEFKQLYLESGFTDISVICSNLFFSIGTKK